MDDWEKFCDATFEAQPHYGIVPETVCTLTRDRALAILDEAARIGLTGRARTCPGSTRRAVWECCSFQISESGTRLIPSYTAEMLIKEFRAEAESVAPHAPD